ncbi:MAG: PPOX class F420-dependent oxidoreductase [Miltoncostaeaceae bacterium]
MNVDEAREFIRENHRGVLATRHPSDSVRMSPIVAAVDDEGQIVISSRETAYKVRYLRDDPWAQICMFNDRFFGPWAWVEGTASILSLPDAMEPLVDYRKRFTDAAGLDWDEYRQRMEHERRVLIRIAPERAGPARQG